MVHRCRTVVSAQESFPSFFSFWYAAGFILADYSIIYGVRTAMGFKGFLETSNVLLLRERLSFKSNWKVDDFKCPYAVMVVLLLALGSVWGASGAFVKREFGHGGSEVQLWLSCIVGPFGVWIRWFLARQFNGRGFGKSGRWKWFPFGTLIANVSAACLMAALATLQKAVREPFSDLCISIGSTHFPLPLDSFIATSSKHSLQALHTIVCRFTLAF